MAIIQYGGIRIDVQANTQGLRSLRTDMAALTRLVNESSGPVGRFERDLVRIAKASEDGTASGEFLKKATDAAIKRFLAAAAASGKYIEALQHVAAVIPAAASRMQQLETQYRSKEKATLDAARALEIQAEREKEQSRALQHAQSLIDQSMTKEQRRSVTIRQLTADLRAGLITQEHYNRAVQAANRLFTEKAATGAVAQFAGGIAGGLSPIGALTAGAIGFTAGQKTLQFAQDSVTAYMDLRQALIKLEVVLGSSSRAMMAFSELRQIAVATNQTSDAVIRGAVTMAQFGVSANDLAPAMRRISEISAGNAERLQSLAIAYGQVAAAGRLTGQETLQFVNAGFSPLAEIARTTGRSMADLRVAMEKGEISVQMVSDAFKSATEEGGRFYGMADKMAQELTGKVNRLTNEFTKLKEELGSFAEAAGLQSLTTLLRDMTADIKYLRSGQGLGPILSSLFEGTEFGQEMGGTMTPMQRMEFEATGMTPMEREARRRAEIEQLLEEEKATLKRQQETLGRNIFDSFKNASGFFADASKKYADTVAAASGAVEKGAKDAIVAAAEARQGRIRDLIQQREAILGKKDQTDLSPISTDLPKAVSMGTREAYELVMRTQNTLQAKQLEEQRKQRQAQELTNKILQESKKQSIIGLIQ